MSKGWNGVWNPQTCWLQAGLCPLQRLQVVVREIWSAVNTVHLFWKLTQCFILYFVHNFLSCLICSVLNLCAVLRHPARIASLCMCVLVCRSERREINPMLSPIPGYEFTASVWPSHCLNNNLINPVFISFSELGRQAGRAWGRTGNAGRKYWGGRGRKPSARTGIWEEFNGRDLGPVNGHRDVKRWWGRREIEG